MPKPISTDWWDGMTPTQLRLWRRGAVDWTQQRLADELGVSRRVVQLYERDRLPIERRTRLALSALDAHYGPEGD